MMLKCFTLVLIWCNVNFRSTNACLNADLGNNLEDCNNQQITCECLYPVGWDDTFVINCGKVLVQTEDNCNIAGITNYHPDQHKGTPGNIRVDGVNTRACYDDRDCILKVVPCGNCPAPGSGTPCDGPGCDHYPNFFLNPGFVALFGNYPGGVAGLATTGFVAIASAAPPALGLFTPLGITFQGVLPATVLTNAVVLAEVSFLVAGIDGAVVLAIFSSSLTDTGFAVPRTIPATAVLLSEPNDRIPGTTISRESNDVSSHELGSCRRPIIPLAAKLNPIKKKTSPLLSKVFQRFSVIGSRLSMFKAKVYQDLGLACLFPRILRPFEPISKYILCKLGIADDGFMEAPPCNATVCLDPQIEDRVITHDRGVPNLDFMKMEVSTIDDCFNDMPKIQFAARILTKLVDDQSCEDARYQSLCQEAISNNRIISQDDCETPDCAGPKDDPFRACFGCDDTNARNDFAYTDYDYGYNGNTIERQTGERYQTTRQSHRVLCRRRRGPRGVRVCILRVDKAMQIRKETYARAQQFIQSEQYLDDDDLAILRIK